MRILTEPKNALVRQYEALFRASNVDLAFSRRALSHVARVTVDEGTGARGLRRLLERVLLGAMFDAPQSSIRYVAVTRRVVEGAEPALYFSRADKWRFEQAIADDDLEDLDDKTGRHAANATSLDSRGRGGGGEGTTPHSTCDEVEREVREREVEKLERAEKRRKKVVAAVATAVTTATSSR